MTTVLEPATSTETMGDLLHRLGDISPDRVRLNPQPGTATEADVLAIDAHEDRLFELIDGVLVEKGVGFWESLLAGAILQALREWVIPRKLGVVVGEAGMMRLFPGTVFIPDVAYVSKGRLPKGRKSAVPNLAPDIAVEVLSASNTKREMKRKRQDYFKAGTRLVWEFDPQSRTVAVYTSPERRKMLTENQTLDGGNVLPGFTLSLRELFAEIAE